MGLKEDNVVKHFKNMESRITRRFLNRNLSTRTADKVAKELKVTEIILVTKWSLNRNYVIKSLDVVEQFKNMTTTLTTRRSRSRNLSTRTASLLSAARYWRLYCTARWLNSRVSDATRIQRQKKALVLILRQRRRR